jgi:AcrR family transcriptional regulator
MRGEVAKDDGWFSKLPGGRSAIGAEEVAAHQRGRLLAAMVELVWRRGYLQTTLKELVGLAGVSYSAFYRHFAGKEECFLAAFDETMERLTERVGDAYRSREDFRDRLKAALDAYVDFATEESAAAYLLVVDSLSLGAAGVARRQQASATFESAFRRSFDLMPDRGDVSETTIRAIVGGMQRVVFSSVRTKETDDLREPLHELLDWGLRYQRPGGARGLQEVGLSVKARSKKVPQNEIWTELPNSLRSRTSLSQRERIVCAVSIVAAEEGYGKLSIPTITARAGVSNQTFYEHFTDKEDAFLKSLDLLLERAILEIGATDRLSDDWAEQAVARLDALLTFTARNPRLARLPFLEVLTAGSGGVAHVDAQISQLTMLYDSPEKPARLEALLPEPVVQAIAGGIYTVIQHEIAEDRADTLPRLLPEIAFVALAPFLLRPAGSD